MIHLIGSYIDTWCAPILLNFYFILFYFLFCKGKHKNWKFWFFINNLLRLHGIRLYPTNINLLYMMHAALSFKKYKILYNSLRPLIFMSYLFWFSQLIVKKKIYLSNSHHVFSYIQLFLVNFLHKIVDLKSMRGKYH